MWDKYDVTPASRGHESVLGGYVVTVKHFGSPHGCCLNVRGFKA
jgi:hypothetical protein